MAQTDDDRAALDRLCDRLRSATEARLVRPDQRLGGASAAEVVYRVAVWAATCQGRGSEVPQLHPLASGDQLAVIGRDFLDWASEGRGRAAELIEWRERVELLRASV